jgi:hypothetical protein
MLRWGAGKASPANAPSGQRDWYRIPRRFQLDPMLRSVAFPARQPGSLARLRAVARMVGRACR